MAVPTKRDIKDGAILRFCLICIQYCVCAASLHGRRRYGRDFKSASPHEKHEKGCQIQTNSTHLDTKRGALPTPPWNSCQSIENLHWNALWRSCARVGIWKDDWFHARIVYAKHNSFQFVKCIHEDPPTWQVMDNSDPVIRQQIRRGMACLVEDTDVEWDPNN